MKKRIYWNTIKEKNDKNYHLVSHVSLIKLVLDKISSSKILHMSKFNEHTACGFSNFVESWTRLHGKILPTIEKILHMD